MTRLGTLFYGSFVFWYPEDWTMGIIPSVIGSQWTFGEGHQSVAMRMCIPMDLSHSFFFLLCQYDLKIHEHQTWPQGKHTHAMDLDTSGIGMNIQHISRTATNWRRTGPGCRADMTLFEVSDAYGRCIELLSGKHRKNYGRPAFVLGKSTIIGHFQ